MGIFLPVPKNFQIGWRDTRCRCLWWINAGVWMNTEHERCQIIIFCFWRENFNCLKLFIIGPRQCSHAFLRICQYGDQIHCLNFCLHLLNRNERRIVQTREKNRADKRATLLSHWSKPPQNAPQTGLLIRYTGMEIRWPIPCEVLGLNWLQKPFQRNFSALFICLTLRWRDFKFKTRKTIILPIESW